MSQIHLSGAPPVIRCPVYISLSSGQKMQTDAVFHELIGSKKRHCPDPDPGRSAACMPVFIIRKEYLIKSVKDAFIRIDIICL